jgi:predicted Zn-dependent peptidase
LQFAICNSSRAAIAPVVTQKLPSGATLATRSDKIAPRVAISLLIRAGAADETTQTAGWRQTLTGALLRATKLPDGTVRTTGQWQRLAQNWGGEFGATTGDDFIELWARGDSAFAPQLLESLLQIASAPRLSDDDIAWARRRALEIVGQPEGGVARHAADAIARSLYRDNKGAPLAYALPDYGTFDSLSGLSNEMLRDLHARFFLPSRFVVSAAGDVDSAALRSVLQKPLTSDKTMDATPIATERAPNFAPLKPGAPPLSVREAQAQGAWIFVAFRTPALSTLPPSDFAALRVLAAALADSSRARLQQRLVREKTVLERRNKIRASEVAVQTAAQWTPRRWAGELVLMAQCDTKNIEAVKNALLDEVHRLNAAPLSPAELQAAKNYARGEWAVQHEQPRERAFQTALPPVWNSFPDTDWPQQISIVTTADIRRVTQKYLQAYSVVLVLPEEN